MKLFRKMVIRGCESRGDAHSAYLTRYYLLKIKDWSVYFHIFHRSDADEMHDHPWPFMSIILWRGYNEEIPCRICLGKGHFESPYVYWCLTQKRYRTRTRAMSCHRCYGSGRESLRKWPGMVLFRPATWQHRVVLLKERCAATVVVSGPRVREWGFFTKAGWQRFQDYFRERGC